MPNLNAPCRLFAATALAALVAAFTGCATAPAPSAADAATKAPAKVPIQLRLIGFNDLHGNLEATAGLTLPWPDPANRERALRLNAGGAAHVAGLVNALRAGAPNSLVLHAGDLIGAAPLVSALFLHESTIDSANRIGIDVAIAGNHEFDAGRSELLRVLRPGCRDGSADSPFSGHSMMQTLPPSKCSRNPASRNSLR